MRLADLQEAYSQAIYAANTKTLESLIHGSPQFTTRSRVDIYRNNTLGALENTLSQVYPVCEALVGENYFKQLAAAHIVKYPSTDRNLDEYGGSFPQTLTNLIQSREELNDLKYLADVAQLEWLVHQSYYAKDRTAFDLETFAQLSTHQQTQVYFKLAADVSLMDSPYPVYDIWLKHQAEIANDLTITISDANHSYLLVQRQQWKTTTQVIDKNLYCLLQAIFKKTLLIDLTEFLAESPIDIAELIQQQIVIGFGSIDNHDGAITKGANNDV